MEQENLLKLAKENQLYTTHLRHLFHQIPELAWEEEQTLALIKQEIKKITKTSKIPIRLTEKKGGIWVDLDFYEKEKRILFRADIDALAVTETTNLPYRSKTKGKMHACGHDIHTAMLLSALKILSEGICKPLNNLRLVWQRAEEVGVNSSGGNVLVQEGVLEGISYCYGLHISSTEEYGTFISRPGCMMCNAGQLHINIACSGGHVMRPDRGSNAIDIMTDIHMVLRGFELRMLGPNELISFVPAISHAGNACNIRPDNGEIWYAVRNFLTQSRLDDFIASIKKRIELITQGYPSATLKKFHYNSGYPKLVNNPNNYHFVDNLLKSANLKTGKIPYLFSGEDFSYYLLNRIGSYWILGACSSEKTDHHTGNFSPDESVLWKGVAFWLLLASSYHPSNLKNEKTITQNFDQEVFLNH